MEDHFKSILSSVESGKKLNRKSSLLIIADTARRLNNGILPDISRGVVENPYFLLGVSYQMAISEKKHLTDDEADAFMELMSEVSVKITNILDKQKDRRYN